MLKTHPRLDWSAIHDNPYTTLFEFDALVTAPLAGYVSRTSSPGGASHSRLTFLPPSQNTAIDYYRAASANNVIRDTAIPLLSISALDDPIVDSSGIPFAAAEVNPWLTFATTAHGGHLGWFEGLFRPRRWVAKPVVEYLRAVHEANPVRRPARDTVPAWSEDRRAEVGDEMVVLKDDSEVGFQRVKVEGHTASGGEAVEGVTQGL